jgi:HK97 family phage prohead protease
MTRSSVLEAPSRPKYSFKAAAKAAPPVEIRAAKESGKRVAYGYAAMFGVRSQLIDDAYFEVLDPESFDDVLARKPDVKFLKNHNADFVLGSTRSGTLRLRTDKTGLAFEADLPNTFVGDEAAELIGRGDVSGMSFSFTSDVDSWSYMDEVPVRTVRSVRDLYDVSYVTYPAYLSSWAKLRIDSPERYRERAQERQALKLMRIALIAPPDLAQRALRKSRMLRREVKRMKEYREFFERDTY